MLEGLHAYAATGRPLAAAAGEAAARGREFLLVHRLFRSHRTARVVTAELTRFHFPPQWRHDALRSLDHFRAAGAPSRMNTLRALRVLRWWSRS